MDCEPSFHWAAGRVGSGDTEAVMGAVGAVRYQVGLAAYV